MTADVAPSLFQSVVTLVVGLAWPLVTGAAIFYFRTDIREALKVLIAKASSADSMKLGPFEMARMYKTAEVKTQEHLIDNPVPTDVPQVQVAVSEELNDSIDELGVDAKQKAAFANQRLTKLALDYNLLRREQPTSSPERTRKMNEIVSLMRTFAVPAFPVLQDFLAGSTAGERLVAIAILQVRPSVRQIDWLEQRFVSEQQPFLLFHSALALQQMARLDRLKENPDLGKAIASAINRVQSFGGEPDRNTLRVLQEAKDLMRSA